MDTKKDDLSSPRAQATRQRLLEAAGKQLMLKGYTGATTRSIAKAAGVSELTLFRHFPTKKALFSTLFKKYTPAASIQGSLIGVLSGDVRQDLITICKQVFAVMIERREAIMITLGEARELDELRDAVAGMPRQARQMMTAYLQMQMNQGKLQQRDPLLAAQALIGMFLSYIITQSLLNEPIDDSEQLVSQFVDIFLNGMMPKQAKGQM